jgi:predicted nuclease of predicted toxin-antitoxin system
VEVKDFGEVSANGGSPPPNVKTRFSNISSMSSSSDSSLPSSLRETMQFLRSGDYMQALRSLQSLPV